jgi:hypothetical protein
VRSIGAATVSVFTGVKRKLLVAAIVSVAIVFTIPMWRAKEYKVYPETFFTGIYNSTTDTGESSPIWSVRFMESRPDTTSYLYPSNGVIVNGPRTTTTRQYAVTVHSPVRFIENTLYFPGWTVELNGKNLPESQLIFQDPTFRGLMTFDLQPGVHSIRIAFRDTKLRVYANLISLISFILFIITIVSLHLWRKRKIY